MASHPAVVVKIEGNTDERGGVEYNLLLGQKRAESVLRALRVHGVKDAQMQADGLELAMARCCALVSIRRFTDRR